MAEDDVAIGEPAVPDRSVGDAAEGRGARRLQDARDWLKNSPVNLALAVGVAVVVALAGLTSWLGVRAYHALQAERLQQMLVAAGRQGAVNLTTIDYEHADADVQRILDSATGDFYDDFANRAKPFADFVKQTQAKSVGTVTEAGLESVGGNEGRVLIAMTIKSSNRGADQPLRAWRLRVTVKKVGDEAKVSRVEPIQ